MVPLHLFGVGLKQADLEHKMTLFDKIVENYPELLDTPEVFSTGIISLRNDGDDDGDYIETWNYEKSLPKGLKIGK